VKCLAGLGLIRQWLNRRITLVRLIVFYSVDDNEKPLYSSSTSGLENALLFGFCVCFGLQFGCEHYYNQLGILH
jgi:hypothetical protein